MERLFLDNSRVPSGIQRLTSEWERRHKTRCCREGKTGTYLIEKSTHAAAVGAKIDLKALSHVINACCVPMTPSNFDEVLFVHVRVSICSTLSAEQHVDFFCSPPFLNLILPYFFFFFLNPLLVIFIFFPPLP